MSLLFYPCESSFPKFSLQLPNLSCISIIERLNCRLFKHVFSKNQHIINIEEEINKRSIHKPFFIHIIVILTHVVTIFEHEGIKLHCLGDCFRPYKHFLNKKTWSSLPWTSNASGCFILICSSSSPCKNVFLNLAAQAPDQIDLRWQVKYEGSYVNQTRKNLIEIKASLCVKPLATSRVLYLAFLVLGIRSFFLRNHFLPTIF